MVITDPAATGGAAAAAAAALRAGAPSLQLRCKEASARSLLDSVLHLRDEIRAANALLIINDRLDVALAAGADGCHLGDDDLPLEAARKIAPPDFILGRSVDTPEEAVTAEKKGASYVGMGPVYPTATKRDTGDVVGEAGIAEARRRIDIPIVGIGGIGVSEAGRVIRAGADGVALISAVMHAADPASATRAVLAEIEEASRDG